MTYQELKERFRSHECSYPKLHLTAYITFASFGPDNTDTYSWKERTYVISSENKAFEPNKGGYSIFGSCLDGSDQNLRLERYIKEEYGGKDGWTVEDCCIVGYLLTGCDDAGIPTPELFYCRQDAHDHMLSQLAKASELNFERLRADFASQRRLFKEDVFKVEQDSAWYSDQAAVDWKWTIQPVRIYDVQRILIGHE